MSLVLTQNYTAIGPNIIASFLGVGGQRPYSYAVVSEGAGGVINSRTGVYTAPAIANASPTHVSDTITVTDAASATASSKILIGTPLILFCDIIQQGMGLADGRVYLWDQKLFEPKDYDLFIAIAMPSPKPFGNNTVYTSDPSGNLSQAQSVNMYAVLDIDIISRGPAARDRKEEVILALNSTYSESQQEANSFKLGKISTNFINLSPVDAAAIPYRYRISCAMQYCVEKITPVQYFSNFPGYTTTTST